MKPLAFLACGAFIFPMLASSGSKHPACNGSEQASKPPRHRGPCLGHVAALSCKTCKDCSYCGKRGPAKGTPRPGNSATCVVCAPRR